MHLRYKEKMKNPVKKPRGYARYTLKIPCGKNAGNLNVRNLFTITIRSLTP
jgi:hypothetical protein